MELIGGRYPLKNGQHIAVLANFSSNDHGDGIRRVRYRPLVRFARPGLARAWRWAGGGGPNSSGGCGNTGCSGARAVTG